MEKWLKYGILYIIIYSNLEIFVSHLRYDPRVNPAGVRVVRNWTLELGTGIKFHLPLPFDDMKPPKMLAKSEKYTSQYFRI